MSQIAEKKFPCTMLLGGLSVNLNHLKTRLATMAVLASQALLRESKKSSNKMLAQVKIEPVTSAIWICWSPVWAIEAIVTWEICKILYGHVPLALAKWFQSNIQVVQEKKTIYPKIVIIAKFACLWKPRLYVNLYTFLKSSSN